MRWYRWLVILLFLALLVAALIYGFAPRPVLVETVTVERAPLSVTVEAEGVTRVRERYLISAPVAGTARRIRLDVGDPVVERQPVAWLEPLRSAVLDPRSRAQAEARVAAAGAELRVAEENASAARAAADFARAELARLRRLRADGVVSHDQLDQAESEALQTEAIWRSAVSTVEVARYGVEAARSALGYSAAEEDGGVPELVTLRTPVAGQVLRVHQQSEFVVQPGTPLLEIGDPADLEVAVDVLSADAVRIAPGDRVWLRRWGGDQDLEGRVRRIEPVGFTKVSALGVEEQRVLVIVDFVSPPEQWQRLGDGYRVEADFVLWEADDVLQVPTGALLRHADGWAVYRVEDGTAYLQPVAIGQRSGLSAEVRDGLEAGMTVIVHPSEAVADGVAVVARAES
jgi:HlyD family secretion protein